MQTSWRRNFYVLWAAQLVAIIGFQAVQPFLPYYIQEFAVADLNEALIWAGRMGTGAGLAMAVASPVWGSLADRFGRKAMVVRSMLGGGVTVAVMAYVTSLEQLLLARTLQGALAGTVAATTTLVCTTTPRQHLGYALGLMQGAVMLGSSVGPFIGGPLIELLGYKLCFVVSGVLVVLAGVVVRLWVVEDFVAAAPGAPGRGAVAVGGSLLTDSLRMLRSGPFLSMVVSLSLIQFAFGFTMPVLPLFLQQLAGTDRVLSVAGSIFAASGLAGALSSALMGRWSDRLGARRTLIGGLLASSLFLLLQGLSGSVGMLAAMMILGGVAGGAVRPVANAMIAGIVPEGDRGKAFGVLTSANAFGWALGPMAGAYLGARLGFRAVFVVTAALFVVVTAWVGTAVARAGLAGKAREPIGAQAGELP
jgi:MFS transporter, DHA1 family, multidrug resistance protein